MFSALDWSEIITHIQSFATSGAGKLKLTAMDKLSSPTAAEASFAKIQDALEIIHGGARPHMESLDLFEAWHSRLKKRATLKPIEIKDLRLFCLETIALREYLQDFSNSLSLEVLQELMDPTESLSAIDQILTPSGDIRSDASETLFRLFREKENLSRQVSQTLDRLVTAHQMQSYLQDKYVTTREGRWVLPIRGGSQHFVPGVIHASSQTKQTVFMEPEAVIPLNNRLREIEIEIEDEIERLLVQLSEYLGAKTLEFANAREILLRMDELLAKAQFSMRIDAQACHFSEDEIHLLGVRHPLLLMRQSDTVIGNTLHLENPKRILLLSGPNAGGKTVLLKSIGLVAQMARCGLLVPCLAESKIPFFDNILVGIGDSQSVDEHLSTFAAHLKVLEKAANLKGLQNLVLIDEICGSTDPEEGGALARSFIETFESNAVFGVVTSHLSTLKSGWAANSAILNGSLEYDATKGVPTYNFLAGVPGESLAIQTARRTGISAAILDRALIHLTPAAKARLSQLHELDQLKKDLQLLREHLKSEQDLAKKEKQKHSHLLQALEQEKEKILEKVRKEAERKIEDLLSAAKAEQTLKKHSQLQEIKTNLPQIIKSKVGASISSPGPIQTAEAFAQNYPTGSKVFVPSLGQDGIIQSLPNSKGEIFVLSGSVRMLIPWQSVKPANSGVNPTAQLVRRAHPLASSVGAVSLKNTDRQIDVRGKTVDEALRELELHLDESTLHSEDRIKIIHGHGTESLKKAIRTFLSRNIYVKKWKAGTPEQGGDGVTWAELGQTD